MNLPSQMIRSCRKRLFRWKVADSTGASVTGGALLTRTLVLRRLLLREVLADDETHVGLLLPPSNGGAIVNAAVTMAGRVSVNLNYSVTSEVLNACIRRAGIRHVLTSRKVMEKLSLDIDAEVFCLEDLRDKVTLADKAASAFEAYALPAAMLDRRLGLDKIRGDDELTVIFTSGSTGEPKGVMLTQENIRSNVEAMREVVHLTPDDVILGILPFFHSFGYTVTLWGPLALDMAVAYHFSPLDAKQVGKLSRARGATILLTTPTFLRSYLKRCKAEEFATLEVVVAGAEKLPASLCDAFEQKFGVRPIEGYGATELSPLVSVNVPPSRSQTADVDCREGSVGRPVPQVRAKVVHPETGETLPTGAEGLLMITGPNLMKGYMRDEAKTASVVLDGWYVTGDIARLDAEGFIHITGRESRFSKIGGEMVPHVLVEEAIGEFLSGGDDDEPVAVVTAVPDAKKGERLIVVHLPIEKTPAEIAAFLSQKGLPNLWVPSADSYMQVEELPLLGSGKLDLKLLASLAKDKFSVAV
ncbi:MAG: AMP-binding protein [Planctomycetota bacterium]